MKNSAIAFLIIVTSFSCNNSNKETADKQVKVESRAVEAISFSGEELYRREADSARLSKFLALIAESEKKESPSEKDFIEWGDQYVSIYAYRDAIKVYTQALEAYPSSFKLLRYRAHRYLSVREVDSALADLNNALALIEGNKGDDLEYYPDGKVKGTYEYWIYYHLGIAHYLRQNYDEAASAFQNCLRTATTGKNGAGATDWLYNIYLASDDMEAATELISSFVIDEEVDRNYAYTKRILMHKGEILPTELFDLNKPSEEWTGTEITLAYGIGNWFKVNGDPEKGIEIKRKILDSPYWNAWAYVVAERELYPE